MKPFDGILPNRGVNHISLPVGPGKLDLAIQLFEGLGYSLDLKRGIIKDGAEAWCFMLIESGLTVQLYQSPVPIALPRELCAHGRVR